VHCSPPCQGYTTNNNRFGSTVERSIHLFRDMLQAAGVDYVIENVKGAARAMRNPVCLTGGAFGLQVERPRLFEATFHIPELVYRKVVQPVAVYGKRPDGRPVGTSGQRVATNLAEARAAMGIDWMDWTHLCQAIPPAYTEHIARSYLARTTAARTCHWCQGPLNSTDPRARYCTNAHRQRHYRHTLTRQEPPTG